MTTKSKQGNREQIFRGEHISPGIAVGKTYLLDTKYAKSIKRTIAKEEIQQEIDHFEAALSETIKDIQLILDQLENRIIPQQREIFDAHMMILEDVHMREAVVSQIRQEHLNADYAFYQVMNHYIQTLKSAKDSVLQERAVDLRDIKRRVINKILGFHRRIPGQLKDYVVVAQELTLFDIRRLAKDKVAGVVLEGGGRTSHIAIMIRSLMIPAIFEVESIFKYINNDDQIIANGLTGEVIVHPTKLSLKQCLQKQENFKKFRKEYSQVAGLPSVTRDNIPFIVSANIETPEDVDVLEPYGSFGIGLYRTEYDFMESASIPTEEILYKKYSYVVKKINPNPVIIRTIDIGGDKLAPFMEFENEKNPFLGWRAIRICLDMPELFKKQLRAILRASAWGKVKLMIPMIATIVELRKAKILINEAKEELRERGMDFDENIEIGIMIEVPSAAIMADQLAKESDFFSIGTNDLIQYTIAIDRTNSRVAKYYNFYMPSILRLIKMTVSAAKKHNIPVGLCGEMAGYPLATALLLGLGITEFSVSPVMLLEIKQILRSLDSAEAKMISSKCLRMYTAREITEYLKEEMKELFPRMDEDYFFRHPVNTGTRQSR
ncbi:phosphoenolpyruvate--protein phosphotransferase [candidate division KSB1 bacterium]